jgi:hypothetical protein
MYIIYSHKSRKSLRQWSHLEHTPANTAFVEQIRRELELSPGSLGDTLLTMVTISDYDFARASSAETTNVRSWHEAWSDNTEL